MDTAALIVFLCVQACMPDVKQGYESCRAREQPWHHSQDECRQSLFGTNDPGREYRDPQSQEAVSACAGKQHPRDLAHCDRDLHTNAAHCVALCQGNAEEPHA